MRIRLTDLPVYCLTCEDVDGKRRHHIQQQWRQQDLSGTFVQPLLGIPKNKSGSSGFFRILELGLKNQKRNKPFQPFLMLEDDVTFTTVPPHVDLDLPDDADMLYVGLSNCSMNANEFHYANYYEPVERFPSLIRIYNMLSMHGIVVCSALGAAAIQRTMLEVYTTSSLAWDIPMAYLQSHYHAYALRIPWVYQDAEYQGCEDCTRITLMDPQPHPLPDEFNVKNMASLSLLPP